MKKFIRLMTYGYGPTAVEYAVMVGLLLLTCLTVITVIGQSNAGGPAPGHIQTVR